MSCQNYKTKPTSPKCDPKVDITTGNLLYNSAPLSCLDVQSGTVLNDIIKNIDALLCDKIANLPICFTFGLEIGTFTIQLTLSGNDGMLNGKPVYNFTNLDPIFEDVDVRIYWDGVKWVLFNSDLGGEYQTLLSTANYPISNGTTSSTWLPKWIDAPIPGMIVSSVSSECPPTPTTTSTTTIAPQPICVTQGYEGVGGGIFINTTNLPEPILFNDKIWYKIINNNLGGDLIESIYWSTTLNAWVASQSSSPINPDTGILQILDNNSNNLPISNSTYQWEPYSNPIYTCEIGGGLICSTSLGSCPPIDICFTVTSEVLGPCITTISSESTYFNNKVWYKIVGTSCGGVIDYVYWSTDLDKWVAVNSSSPSPNPSTDTIIQTLDNFYVYPISGLGTPAINWEPYEGNPDYDCDTSGFGGIICQSVLGECPTPPCSTAICGETYEGYGYLYNWYTLPDGIVNIYQPYTDERNQWRVPSNEDWDTLATYLGGEGVVGGKLKTTCTIPFSTNNGLWEPPNNGATNEVNWVGVPGGYRDYDGPFFNINYLGYWWSSTEASIDSAWYRTLDHSNSNANRNNYLNTGGFSIRLVRPATPSELLLADGTTSNDDPSLPHYIGNTHAYITVKIGTQIWTAQNLIEEKYNDGSPIPEVTGNAEWTGLTTGARCSYNNGAPLTNGTVELCGTTDVTPTCCYPVINEVYPGTILIPDVYEGPATFIDYTYPGTDFCTDCVNLSIEYSIDNGETWTSLGSNPCTDSPRFYTIDQLNITLNESQWRSKVTCAGGGESEYSPIYIFSL